MRPFLAFANWAYRDAIDNLIEHGLSPEVGSWALRASAHRYYRIFIMFAVPYFGSIVLYSGILTLGAQDLKVLLEQTSPFPTLFLLFLSWLWYRQGGGTSPATLLSDLLSMASNLTSLDGPEGEYIIAADGYKWPGHEAISAHIAETTRKAEALAWRFSKKVATLAGSSPRERTNRRWSRTSRAVMYAIEQPLNAHRRNLAYKACAKHIEQLHSGKLYEPVSLPVRITDTPELRPPRLRARIQEVLRTQATYTVMATLIAASVGPFLTALLRP